MSEELKRTREALGAAIACLQRLSTLGGTSSVGNEMAREGLDKVESLLNPPPEFEKVSVGAYFVVPTDGDVYTQVSEERAMQMRDEGYTVAFLSATIKRPVRRAVIREYEVAGKIGALGDVIGVGLTSRPFLDHPECHGKAGVLIFRTAE